MQTINGYPIIATFDTPAARGTRPGRVIMVDRGEGAHNRFVTAWQGTNEERTRFDGSWTWGHYFDSEKEAAADFVARSKRGY